MLWKDDKQFLHIRIDIENPFPVITLARQKTHPKSMYFGPFIHGRAAHAAVDFIQRHFGLKRCRASVPKKSIISIVAMILLPIAPHPVCSISRQRRIETCSRSDLFFKGDRMDLLGLRAEMHAKSEAKA